MKAIALTLLVLLAGLPLRAATIVAEPFPPAQMSSLYLELDDKGTTTTLQVVGDAVIYKVSKGNTVLESDTLHPTGDDWFKFIQGLNAAKVYNWAPKYYYPGQGPTWVIDFAMEDRKFTSEGTNDYPKEGDESQPQAGAKDGPSVPFQLFWQAVLGLVGKSTPLVPK